MACSDDDDFPRSDYFPEGRKTYLASVLHRDARAMWRRFNDVPRHRPRMESFDRSMRDIVTLTASAPGVRAGAFDGGEIAAKLPPAVALADALSLVGEARYAFELEVAGLEATIDKYNLAARTAAMKRAGLGW